MAKCCGFDLGLKSISLNKIKTHIYIKCQRNRRRGLKPQVWVGFAPDIANWIWKLKNKNWGMAVMQHLWYRLSIGLKVERRNLSAVLPRQVLSQSHDTLFLRSKEVTENALNSLYISRLLVWPRKYKRWLLWLLSGAQS